MKGGYIEYAPLPCDANGNTDWESTNQVGRESCVDYGTDGAELDARASKFGYDMEGLAYEKASSKLSEEDAKLLADAREALRAQNNKENTPEISPKFNNAFKEYQKASDALSKAEVATNPTLSPSAIDDLQAEVKAAGNAMRASVNSNNK